jgi:D-tyrosyl-tRNA(Tyr) deacylase
MTKATIILDPIEWPPFIPNLTATPYRLGDPEVISGLVTLLKSTRTSQEYFNVRLRNPRKGAGTFPIGDVTHKIGSGLYEATWEHDNSVIICCATLEESIIALLEIHHSIPRA